VAREAKKQKFCKLAYKRVIQNVKILKFPNSANPTRWLRDPFQNHPNYGTQTTGKQRKHPKKIIKKEFLLQQM
jgi:hypothetical protein